MPSPGRDFEGWYAEEHPPLLRAVVVATRDVDVASEIVAEAFSRAYERWEQVQLLDNPSGWVYRVAINLLRRRWRRAQLERRWSEKRSRSEIVNGSDVVPELWLAVAALPWRQREAIALRYVADLSERQVAEAMGVAEGTASATLAAARRALASQLHHLEELNST